MTALQPNSISAMNKQELEHTLCFFKLLSIMELIQSSQSLTCFLSRSGCHQTNTEQTHSEVIRNICSNTEFAFTVPRPLSHLSKSETIVGFFNLASYGSGKCSVTQMSISVQDCDFLLSNFPFCIPSPSIF